MIQDIAPHRYDNTYHIQKPGAQDYVFCIQRGRILLRETAEEHMLTICLLYTSPSPRDCD